jgi:predicted nucleic acid-binding protein
MKRQVILDTGPLVAFINGRDRYHEWSTLQWSQIDPPFLTCEAVLSESCYLLKGIEGGQAIVLELLRRGVLNLSFRIDDSIKQITWLLQKYSDVPMSLADACLVRMSELYAESHVLTLDDHSRIYRKNKTQVIPIFSPSDF